MIAFTFSFSIALLPLLLGADLQAQKWREFGDVEQHAHLPTNVPSQIYKELRDPLLIGDLAGDLKDAGISVIFGGADESYTVALLYNTEPKISDAVFLARLKSYVRLRWRGFGAKTAMRMSKKVPFDEITDPKRADDALFRKHCPEIPVDEWKPTKEVIKASLYWLDNQRIFVVLDEELSLVWDPDVSPLGVIYTIDSRELKGPFKNVIEKTAREVHRRLEASATKRVPIVRFWEILKAALAAKGVEWQTPADLNPHIFWE